MNKKYLTFIFIIFIISLNYFCCQDATRDPNAYIIEGMMYFRDIEGGCWQFIDGNNKSYEIVGDDVELIHIDSLFAKLIVRDYTYSASTCMVGKIVELLEIIETKQL